MNFFCIITFFVNKYKGNILKCTLQRFSDRYGMED